MMKVRGGLSRPVSGDDVRSPGGAKRVVRGTWPRATRTGVILLLVSLTTGALFAVWTLLFGRFGEVEGKIVGSTLLLGAFSLTGLAAALRLEQSRAVWLGWLGIAASVAAYVLSLVVMWAEPEVEGVGRAMGSAVLAALALGFVSLLVLIRPRSSSVRWALGATLGLTTVVWAMAEYLVITTPEEPDERYLRVMGAAAVLVALGAILTPILDRLGRRDHPPPGAGELPARA